MAAILGLEFISEDQRAGGRKIFNLPPVNICENTICLILTMFGIDILNDPRNKMIFKGILDDLMKKVRCQKFMDVGVGKMGREWLGFRVCQSGTCPIESKTDVQQGRLLPCTRPINLGDHIGKLHAKHQCVHECME
jgi:hypothetical protein